MVTFVLRWYLLATRAGTRTGRGRSVAEVDTAFFGEEDEERLQVGEVGLQLSFDEVSAGLEIKRKYTSMRNMTSHKFMRI